MMMAGAYAPPISLFTVLPEKRETGRARSKEKRERGPNLTAGVKFGQDTGAGLNRCQCELPAFYRLRQPPFRDGTLRRSCECLRGCFVSLTQGLQRLFPRFAPSRARVGRTAVLPPVDELSSPHGARQARSAGREESPYVYPSNFLRALQSKRNAPASAKSVFFSFGPCTAKPCTPRPRPRRENPRPAPVGRHPPSPAGEPP